MLNQATIKKRKSGQHFNMLFRSDPAKREEAFKNIIKSRRKNPYLNSLIIGFALHDNDQNVIINAYSELAKIYVKTLDRALLNYFICGINDSYTKNEQCREKILEILYRTLKDYPSELKKLHSKIYERYKGDKIGLKAQKLMEDLGYLWDYNIFISYAHEDKQFVDKLVRDLINENFKVWIDRQKLAIGSNIDKDIIKSIPECKFFLVIWSHNSKDSIEVEREIESAFNFFSEGKIKKPLISLYGEIEEDIIPSKFYRDIYLDFRRSDDDQIYNEELQKLLKVIKDEGYF